MKDHKELDVWKKGMEFAVDIYQVTNNFPPSELYGLTSQLRKSAVSIPSNIAEGAARNTEKEFLQFLFIASGSAAEAETQILLARRLDFAKDLEVVLSKLVTVKKLLHGLIRHYKNKR